MPVRDYIHPQWFEIAHGLRRLVSDTDDEKLERELLEAEARVREREQRARDLIESKARARFNFTPPVESVLYDADRDIYINLQTGERITRQEMMRRRS